MKRSVKVNEKIYEEGYFEGSFHGAVGKFSKSDLQRSINWFTGWINFVNGYVDLENGKGRSALEIGCSIGGAANVLAKNGFEVTATDISKYALKHAQKLSPKIAFAQIDVEKPIQKQLETQKIRRKSKSNGYDIVCAFEVFEHLQNTNEALKNIYNALAPNGVFICSTPYPYKYAMLEPTHIHVRYPFEWLAEFRNVGFPYIQYQQVSFVPLLYKLHAMFSAAMPVAVNTRFINSTVFLIAHKSTETIKK